MRFYFVLLLLSLQLFGDDFLASTNGVLNAIVHSEYETMQGRSGDDTLPKESNAFSTLYADMKIDHDFSDDFFVSLGAKGNLVLGEDRYDTMMYQQTKVNADELNRVMLSEASFNYDNDLLTLNVGRQQVDYNWLLGSIDGILGMVGSDESVSLRLFWFENYHHLQYNYYMQVEGINVDKGMYGAIAKAAFDYADITLFDYYLQDIRNLYGSDVTFLYENFGINLSYAAAQALPLAAYDYDERFFNGSIEGLIGRHYFELGGSLTGENGLLALLQLGSNMFGQFYLSNQVDRENARNGFLRYVYANSSWRFEAIGGATRYDNSFIRLENALESYEIDCYLQYHLRDDLSFELGVMYMDVDEADPLQVDQSFVMLNMVYHYETY